MIIVGNAAITAPPITTVQSTELVPDRLLRATVMTWSAGRI